MLSLTTLLSLTLAASSSLAATITVDVGSGGALKYDPETVTAAIGDVVNFNFLGGAHTASQSTFAAPCVNAGFNSGPKPASGANTTFSIMVNSTTPIWVYCATGQHCQAGMVMAINPPATGNTFSAFQAAAMGNAASAGASAGASASISGSASASGASAAASPSPTGGASTLGGSIVLSGLGAVVAGVAALL